jgi:hypothetical protein
MTSLAYIEDKCIKVFNYVIAKRMIIMTDRPQGVASLNDGEIEINIDRIAGEDGRGVGEVLNKR